MFKPPTKAAIGCSSATLRVPLQVTLQLSFWCVRRKSFPLRQPPLAPTGFRLTRRWCVASGADPADFPLSYQWQLNGTNIPDAAASNYTISVHDVYGHLRYDVMQEGSYSVVVSNAAGSTTVTAWDLRLAAPGMVAAWGNDDDGECERPRTLTNTLAVAAGLYHSVAVAEDGSVVTWGANWGNVPGRSDQCGGCGGGLRSYAGLAQRRHRFRVG